MYDHVAKRRGEIMKPRKNTTVVFLGLLVALLATIPLWLDLHFHPEYSEARKIFTGVVLVVADFFGIVGIVVVAIRGRLGLPEKSSNG